MTLVELLIVMIITTVMLATVGTLMITSFSSSSNETTEIEVDNDARYFQHQFEYEFRNATIDNVNIFSNTMANDSVSFVTTDSNSPHTYMLQGTNLIHSYGPLGIKETLMTDVFNLTFNWAMSSTCTLTVGLNQSRPLPGGGAYNDVLCSFNVTSRNRIRGIRSDEKTK
jgi:type II secretory pathway pseudopilin PulG